MSTEELKIFFDTLKDALADVKEEFRTPGIKAALIKLEEVIYYMHA